MQSRESNWSCISKLRPAWGTLGKCHSGSHPSLVPGPNPWPHTCSSLLLSGSFIDPSHFLFPPPPPHFFPLHHIELLGKISALPPLPCIGQFSPSSKGMKSEADTLHKFQPKWLKHGEDAIKKKKKSGMVLVTLLSTSHYKRLVLSGTSI